MIKGITVIAACILTGCASMPPGMSVDTLLGTKVRDGGFYGSGPTATIRVKQRLTDRTWCEYEHVSFLLKGPPFGPRTEEDSLNHVGCGVRFGDQD